MKTMWCSIRREIGTWAVVQRGGGGGVVGVGPLVAVVRLVVGVVPVVGARPAGGFRRPTTPRAPLVPADSPRRDVAGVGRLGPGGRLDGARRVGRRCGR